MIVRAGGLTLRAPDVMPEEVADAVASLRALLIATSTVPTDTVMPSVGPHLAAVEVAAFGRRHAGRLRRCGRSARLSASRQLLDAWGQAVGVLEAPPWR